MRLPLSSPARGAARGRLRLLSRASRRADGRRSDAGLRSTPPVAFPARMGEAGFRLGAARPSTHVESDSGLPRTRSGAGFHPPLCGRADAVFHRFGPHQVGGTRPAYAGPMALEAQIRPHAKGQVPAACGGTGKPPKPALFEELTLYASITCTTRPLKLTGLALLPRSASPQCPRQSHPPLQPSAKTRRLTSLSAGAHNSLNPHSVSPAPRALSRLSMRFPARTRPLPHC